MKPKDLLLSFLADDGETIIFCVHQQGRKGRDLTYSLMVFSYLMALFLIRMENKLNANMSLSVILSKVVSFIRLDFTRVPFISNYSFYFNVRVGLTFIIQGS